MRNSRRSYVMGAAAAGLLAAAGGLRAQPEPFPSKPVRIIVPFPSGGPIDQTARLMSLKLSDVWKQPVVVDNRTGASGIVAAETAFRSPSDGYTLLFSVIHHTVLPSMRSKLSYDIEKDFDPITLAAVYPIILVVSAQSPIKTVSDLVAQARAEPGTLTFGHSGRGGGAHLAGELFKIKANVDLRDVPYKGNGPAIVDLIADRLSVMFADIPSALPHVQSGRLRALAISTPERSSLLPKLPTVIEAGVPGYTSQTWGGISVRSGTPKGIVDRLSTDITAVLRDPDMRERMRSIGAEPMPQTPRQYGDFIRAEMSKWAAVVKQANITME